MKYLKAGDTFVFVLCFIGGLFVMLNCAEIPVFIFAAFWVVLLLAYVRILDYDAYFIVDEKESENNEKENL